MADCKYCKKKAGVFRKFHKECQAAYQDGWARMLDLATRTARGSGDFDTLQTQIAEIAAQSHQPEKNLHAVLVAGWEQAVVAGLEDDLLSGEEQDALERYAAHFALSQEELNANGMVERAAKATALRHIMEGDIPTNVDIVGQVPFNLQKSEMLVWAFPGSLYYEERTRRHYEGGHQGVSVRVMKGLYYRAGGFRGHPVDTTAIVHVDTGLVGVTTKHIYFSGNSKSFRARFDKIVSFTPYEDGIGIMRDAASAKPQIFVTGDGWFIYNLVTNLARLL